MSAFCPKSINGMALRVTAANACGVASAVETANSRVQTDGFVTAELAPALQTGTEITTIKANGLICVSRKQGDQLKWIDTTLNFCGVPYPALSLLLGLSALTSDADIIGAVLPSKDAQLAVAPTIIEIWSLNAGSDACSGDASLPFVQWLLPLSTNWQINGNITFGPSAVDFSVKGQVYESPGFTAPVTAEWSDGDVTAIRAGGPLAWKGVAALPALDECNFVGAGS